MNEYSRVTLRVQVHPKKGGVDLVSQVSYLGPRMRIIERNLMSHSIF